MLGWGINWNNELADELHKPIRKKFKKRSVFASGTDAIWTANLVDMQSVSRSNKGFKYISWAIPLKTKTGPEVTKAFQHLWEKQKPPQK